jgi:putative Ca2+/H+ antiporter (TMEM165/GDT1 family)|tara:strand:- start:732 stop:1823 length:1092 start_codon:yes stop_codon:yes gene_type:complete
MLLTAALLLSGVTVVAGADAIPAHLVSGIPAAIPTAGHRAALPASHPAPLMTLQVDRSAPAFQRLTAHFHSADRDLDGLLSESEFVSYEVSQAAAHAPSLFDFSATLSGAVVPEKFKAVVAKMEFTKASFWPAFFNSISMIIVTELGDKTFFIAAILAMRQDRWSIYIGAVGALALMTVLSVVIGFALPQLLPRKYTHFVASLLFLYFGIRLLLDAYNTRNNTGPSEELQEVEEEFGSGHAKDDEESSSGGAGDDVESGGGKKGKKAGSSSLTKMAILTQAFTLTFFAEWGDRSQIATIALAAAKNPYGVTLGGVLGHALCTAIAVLGGRLLAMKISERAVFFVGGLLFLAFAVHAFVTGPSP